MEQVREEWKPAAGFEGRYEVSSKGQIRNARTGQIRRCTLSQDGYQRFSVRLPGRPLPTTRKVHVLVARAFLGPRPKGLNAIHHIDHDKENNSATNLEYVTAKQNHDFAVTAGRKCQKGRWDYTGKLTIHARLTPDQVIGIRALQGSVSARRLAAIAKVNVSHVYRIWHGGPSSCWKRTSASTSS